MGRSRSGGHHLPGDGYGSGVGAGVIERKLPTRFVMSYIKNQTTAHTMKKITFLLPFFSAALAAQVTVQDDAKVGVIVTGTGNTINTTQIFGKSPEYAELKNALATLEAEIQKKAATCEKMAKDNLPAEYRDGCRSELIALNARRDSVQKIETRFREDVVRLAESFSKMELNSERLRLAKSLFDEGKIREADHVLNAREMKQEGDALLAEKAREQEKLQRTDSLLRIKADEFALKARLKATDYADSLRYDSAQVYFEQSRKYAETVENLQSFSILLWKDNQTPLAIFYGERALQLPFTESEEAALTRNLGSFYHTNKKMGDAEKMYLRSLDICERLAKSNPAQFEPELAATAMNLGVFYFDVQKMDESGKMYLRSLDIRERLAKSTPAQFEPDLATTAMNLGNFYADVQKMGDAEKMYLRSLDIRERLAKANPAQFEQDLAATVMNLGVFYYTVQKMGDAEKMYLRSLEIYERLAQSNPEQFEPNLAKTAMNLGLFYYTVQKMGDAEKMHLRSLEIYERLAQSNPEQFEPDLAKTAMNLGLFYSDVQKMGESEKMLLRSLEIFERLAKSNPAQFESDLAGTLGNLSWFYLFVKKYAEAEKATVRVLALNPAKNLVRTNLGHSHLLRGDWPKAKAVYEEYLKNEADPAEAKKALAKDWDELEAAGITCPEMAMARKWAKE
ncbi:MAG: tetratricopeptide repeat protein [Saprospiraceae bacterium]